MLKFTQQVAGREAIIRVLEDENDKPIFHNWLDGLETKRVALDTETTGLDIYSTDFGLRLIQIGQGLEAWVLPEHVVQDLDWLDGFELVIQNATFDVAVLRKWFNHKFDWDKIWDTKILAHLIDSRSKNEGGFGHSLQELTAEFIDAKVAEEVKGSMGRMCRETKLKKSELFANIDLFNETYLIYAGMDVILTYGLFNVLLPKVPESARGLIRREHSIAEVCHEMAHTGFLLDEQYAQQLYDTLTEDQEAWEAYALVNYGTESVNANAQVAADLVDDGVELTERTVTGNLKLDKTILEPLAEQGNMLAVAVLQAKKAKKWRETWVAKFLDGKDADGYCHAFINPLQARTGRMSITGIPAQTLPSSDWMIRRCFIAEPGNTIVSCDYAAQELRVLAALSGDRNMTRAFAENADLHQMTADASGVERSVGKTVNFAYVYGSGPANIAKTCGISVPKAKEVIRGFETTYPGVKRLADRLTKEAKRNGYITTPSGRRLYVDKDRAYSALNYMIQSTSRDITSAALLRLHQEGFTPYLRLPIHDEIVASVPTEHAEWGAKRIAELMRQTFNGVIIDSDADVYGPSWGSGYVKDEDQQAYKETLKTLQTNHEK